MQAVQTLRVITFAVFLELFFQGSSSVFNKEPSLLVGCFSAYGSKRPAREHFCFATPGHTYCVLPVLHTFCFHVTEGDAFLPFYTVQTFSITVMISGYRKL
jgi:hypothetical protein